MSTMKIAIGQTWASVVYPWMRGGSVEGVISSLFLQFGRWTAQVSTDRGVFSIPVRAFELGRWVPLDRPPRYTRAQMAEYESHIDPIGRQRASCLGDDYLR